PLPPVEHPHRLDRVDAERFDDGAKVLVHRWPPCLRVPAAGIVTDLTLVDSKASAGGRGYSCWRRQSRPRMDEGPDASLAFTKDLPPTLPIPCIPPSR